MTEQNIHVTRLFIIQQTAIRRGQCCNDSSVVCIRQNAGVMCITIVVLFIFFSMNEC